MDQGDTFDALKRTPFKEMVELYFIPRHSEYEINEFFNKHGWNRQEFQFLYMKSIFCDE